MSDDFYYTKYLKYKAKYLNLIKQTGGEITCTRNPTDTSNGIKTVHTCCRQGDRSICEYKVVKTGEEEDKVYKKLEIETKGKFNPSTPAPAPAPGQVQRPGLFKKQKPR